MAGENVKKKATREESWTYVNQWYLIIPLAILIALYIAPLCRMLYMSFFEFNGVGKPVGAFTFDYYLKFFTSSYYWSVLGRTMYLGLLSTIIIVIIGYPMAYKMSRTKGKLRNLMNTIVILPLWVSISVRLFGWSNVMSSNGFISKLVGLFTDENPVIIGTNAAIIIGLVYCSLSYFIMVMVGPLENIHPSIEEASYVFGAGFFSTFLRITLPMTIKAAVYAGILVFALNTAAFVVPVMLGSGKITVMTNLIYNRAVYSYDWSFASALSVIFMITAFTITCLGNLFTKQRQKNAEDRPQEEDSQ